MTRFARFLRSAIPALLALIVAMSLPASLAAQRRGAPPPPPPSRPRPAAPRPAPPPPPRQHPVHPPLPIAIRGHVFIGGYFYDPFFGPYPWWQRGVYPRWYFPVYGLQAQVKIHVEPKIAEDAAVYVDGFYAGVVDDFNGFFQALPLTPGGHTIVLFLEGYRTVRRDIYLSAGSTFSLRTTMLPLRRGERSAMPDLAPPVPPPPPGTYRGPVTPPRVTAPPSGTLPLAEGFGTLDLFVQPSTADVLIDGRPWASSDSGHFIIDVPAGRHRIEVRRTGYRTYVSEIEIRDGEIKPLNVSLVAGGGR